MNKQHCFNKKNKYDPYVNRPVCKICVDCTPRQNCLVTSDIQFINKIMYNASCKLAHILLDYPVSTNEVIIFCKNCIHEMDECEVPSWIKRQQKFNFPTTKKILQECSNCTTTFKTAKIPQICTLCCGKTHNELNLDLVEKKSKHKKCKRCDSYISSHDRILCAICYAIICPDEMWYCEICKNLVCGACYFSGDCSGSGIITCQRCKPKICKYRKKNKIEKVTFVEDCSEDGFPRCNECIKNKIEY